VKEIREAIAMRFPCSISSMDIRFLEINDIIERSEWPTYAGYHKGFNLSLADIDAAKRKYNAYSNENAITFSLIDKKNTVGFFSFNCIDWVSKTVGNMTIRIHPGYCNKGIGKTVLPFLCDSLLDSGINSIRLDVHNKNAIAHECYKKSGFYEIDTISRDDELYILMEKNRLTIAST